MTQYKLMWEDPGLRLLWIEIDSEKNELMKKISGYGREKSMYIFKNKKCSTYYSLKDLEEESKFGLQLCRNSKKAIRLIKESYVINSKALECYYLIFQKNLKRKSNKELAAIFKEMLEWQRQVYAYYELTQPQRFYAVEKEIRGFLKQRTSNENNVHDNFFMVTTPSRLNFLNKKEVEWLNIVLMTKKKGVENTFSYVVNHAKKYGLLGAVEGGGKIWDSLYYTNQLEKDVKRDVKEIMDEIKEIMDKPNYFRIKRELAIKKLNLSQHEADLCKITREFTHNRLEIRPGWSLLRPIAGITILPEIARRANLTVNEVESCILDELFGFLEDNKQLDKEKIRQRVDYFVFFSTHGKKEVYAGKEAETYEKKFGENIDFEKINEVRGTVASRGKATGKVKVIGNDIDDLAKEMETMEQGAILVTGMTRPQMILACKKAAAIVTEEGGICSHAAIVSREFNIPCIVGTDIAARVFKDGDMVEVDAEKGIVRKISKTI